MEQLAIAQSLANMEGLPTTPSIVSVALDLATEGVLRRENVARVILADPSLAVRTLLLARQVGRPWRDAPSLEVFLYQLDHRLIRNLLLGTVAFEVPAGPAGTASDCNHLFLHNLTCAYFAEALAGQVDADRASLYLCGLLHDLGRLALYQHSAHLYAAILPRLRDDLDGTVEDETAAFGLDHTLAGRLLADRWSLPDVCREVIEKHHQQSDKVPLPVKIVSVADKLSRDVRIDLKGNIIAPALMATHVSPLNIGRKDFLSIVARVRSNVARHLVDLGYQDASVSPTRANIGKEILAAVNQDLIVKANQLEEQTLYMKALHCINRLIGPKTEAEEATRVLAESVRQALMAQVACCYFFDRLDSTIVGYYDAAETPRPLKLRPFENRLSEGMPEFSAEATGRLRKELQGLSEAAGSGARQIMLAPGAVLVRLRLDEDTCGGLVVASWPGQERSLEKQLEAIELLAGSAELALGRILNRDSLQHLCDNLVEQQQHGDRLEQELVQSKKMAALGEMAAGAAHEINNPLAAISGRLQLLMKKEGDDKKMKALNGIQQQCARIERVVHDLLVYSKPVKPQQQEESVAEICETVAKEYRPSVEGMPIELVLRTAESLPLVRVDSGQIRMVIGNLVKNAIDAMEGRSGTVRIDCRRALQPRDSVVVTVRDVGKGIRAEHIDRIFDPFFTTKEPGKGTGLGLALSQSLASGNGGELTVESTPGKGAQFTLTLPAARATEHD